jgi:RimJ/RimL family protein N-acetyltransferase
MEPTLNITYTKLTEPTLEFSEVLNKWENDQTLVHLTRPNQNKEALEKESVVTLDSVKERLEHNQIFLIRMDGQIIGELSFQVDPAHLYKKEMGTAWIGITIGEKIARGKGIGFSAMQYLEEQIKQQGLKRMELGVFEFNTVAIKLYKKLGFQEIARIDDFTYWQDKMWQDIRMEKYF